MRIRILSILALVALLCPANAKADTISILSDFGPSNVGYFFDGVRSPPSGGIPLGGLSMGNANVPGFDFPDSFQAYCVQILAPILEAGYDVGNTIQFPVTYDVEVASMTTWSDPPLLSTVGVGGQRAAYLYNVHGGVTTGDERTALQMAIWEVLYDVDLSVSLATGRFYVDPQFSNIRTIANGWLSEILTNPLAVASSDAAWLQLTFVDPQTNERKPVQDFIGPVPTPTSVPVPEPGAGLLLGMGMTAVAAFRSRKSLFPRA